MSFNPSFSKEKSLFDTDMSLFGSPCPTEKTSLLPPHSTLPHYHQDDSPSDPSSGGYLQATAAMDTAAAATSTAASESSMADTNNSTTTTTSTGTATADANETIQEEEQDDDEPESPYENLLKQATLWTMEMRSLRDEIFLLQVHTAVKLDHLTMLGADEMMDFESY